ncbi:ras GTPase-activating protein 4-like isoform X3 [Pyrgilauda ruficollis]|uniref:ras GTPase-activating protein 4-like isoform X3 n=1 Tax=Pyrgilauda ruficollis TaxID=221976 RepID=UPI001B8746B0|nr:ras GTPase-activating protein 4-like isoform X3 [Pyrgilauda ruficollis]XP_041338375.1 ras GTPase-activating protein 4-like isoform X3 [Pyrgilauda ruficollis]
MARRSALSIRIVEGRNLPAKDITGSSDPYCIVKIDDEAIIRTATVWKTLSPFWGEEYEVQLQPGFHSISIYVMDEDALSRDDIIGKVCITRDMLAEHPKGYSGWMSLSEVDPDEEVQGEIHLRVEVLGSQGSRRLRCSVLEARDLARKDRNGASDPFVRLRYNGKTQESTVVKKSCYPRWNETFEFELAEPAGEKLCVEVWDWDLVGRNDFLGKVSPKPFQSCRGPAQLHTQPSPAFPSQVVFSIQGLEAAGQEEGWFRLWPDKSKPTEDERRGSLGSLQLQVKLRDETVLPSHCYQPLVQLLCQEVKSGRQDGQVHLVTLLDETTTAECRQEVAINLVKLFLGQGLVKEFLDLLFELELAKPCEPNTLFRSNSLASKSMESFLKVTGMPYLHFVLGPTIARVFEEKKYVELDPGKVEIKDVGCSGLHRVQTEGEVIEQGRQHLQSYLGELLDAIVRSAPACPPLIRAAFRQLFQRVGERFPQHQHAKFVAVTSFLCLRFFSPAVMTPKLFQLRATHADARTSRTLLLLAKAIQLIGNMEPAAGRAKETWLSPLLPALQQGTARMRDFITRLVGTEEEQGEQEGEGRPLGPSPAVVKEGLLLVHKTRGKGPLLAAAAGKKLHFCLTGESLSFGKSPAHRCHRPGRHPGGREGGGEELRQLPRHAGGLPGLGRAAGDGVPAVQVCQRAEPVAVSPAQGVRQQPPSAPLLPPRRLPRGQVELLPPARQDRVGMRPDAARRHPAGLERPAGAHGGGSAPLPAPAGPPGDPEGQVLGAAGAGARPERAPR